MAILTGTAGQGFAPARFQQNFYGEDAGIGVTSVNLMGANDELGIPFPTPVITRNVAVAIRRDADPGGPWTARLFKNGVEVATFSVATS